MGYLEKIPWNRAARANRFQPFTKMMWSDAWKIDRDPLHQQLSYKTKRPIHSSMLQYDYGGLSRNDMMN